MKILQSIEAKMLASLLQEQLNRVCGNDDEIKISLTYVKEKGLEIECHPCAPQAISAMIIHAYLAYTDTIGETGDDEDIERENALMAGFAMALDASVDVEQAERTMTEG